MKEWKVKKKRKTHKESILQTRKECYLCELHGKQFNGILHKHHVYGGANRDISEAEGFTVYLCPGHHNMSKEGVHNNAKNMLLVRQAMQRRYEEEHSREEFMKLIGRSYL